MNTLNIINRPTTTPGALTFVAQGGATMWGNYALTREDVEAICGVFWDEQHAARVNGDADALHETTEALNELLIAYTTAARWRACGSHTYKGS